MAANILKAGHALVVHDVVRGRSEKLAGMGAQIAADPSDVGSRARIAVLMVDTIAQVEEVLFGLNGLIQTAQEGDKVVCMGTIDPEAVKRFSKKLVEKGVGIIDSPVSGMKLVNNMLVQVGWVAIAEASRRPLS
jgi:3-hydroxyisobutyrate dehydrogenase-like beta-hydroxyacid dehydrogenase